MNEGFGTVLRLKSGDVAPATPPVPFAIAPDSTDPLLSTPYTWYKIKLKTFTSATTAPILSRIIGIFPDTGRKYVNITSVVNGSTTVIPPTAASFFPTNEDEVVVVTTDPLRAFVTYTFLAIQDFGGYKFQYLSTDGTRKSFTNLVDPSNGFRNGPTVATTPPTRFETTWTLPADAAKATQSYPMMDGTTQTFTGYFMYLTPINVNPVGEYPGAGTVRRAKQLGTPNVVGISRLTPSVLRGIDVNRIGFISADTTFQVVNMTTGNSVPIEIKSTDLLPKTYDIPDMSFAAGDVEGLLYESGGALVDVDLELVWG